MKSNLIYKIIMAALIVSAAVIVICCIVELKKPVIPRCNDGWSEQIGNGVIIKTYTADLDTCKGEE